MPSSERRREIKRRRHRREKINHFKKRVKKATPSEKAHIAEKIRSLTPGAEEIIGALGLEPE